MNVNSSPIPHHYVTAPLSPTPSSSPPSLSLDDAEPVPLLDSTPPRFQGGLENNAISIRTTVSPMRRSVSSYSVDELNYHPHGGSTTSISTIATTAVLPAYRPYQHYHRHISSLPAGNEDFHQKRRRTSTMSTACPLVAGLRSQVATVPKIRKSTDVSKVTPITSLHLQSSSSSSSSSSRGRFQKFAVKVVKWIRQSMVESRSKSEVRVKCLLHEYNI